MGHSTVNQRGQGTTRRAFLKQVLALTGVTAGTALLNACGSSSATATAVLPVVQQPTALPSNVPAPTLGATAGIVSTPATGAAPTGEATARATTPSQDATPRIVAAANAFLATLDNNQKSSVMFDWSNTAQKQRWSNLPEGAFERAGLMWGDISETQQNAWLAIMQATLSSEGYKRGVAEWNADDALAAQQGSGGGGRLIFGKKYYWIAIIGTPSETAAWQWQWGGHHVTVNATIVGPNISLTPSFIQKAAILGSSPIDLVLGPGQDGKTIQSEGLPAAQMTADQQAALLKLIGHYAGLVNDEDAATRMAEIKSTQDQTYFAWYGPTTQGSAAYFRITGPTLVIEYSPQQMGGDPANHIHGIYRDPTNDYGAKYAQ